VLTIIWQFDILLMHFGKRLIKA